MKTATEAPRTGGLVWPQRQRCRKCRNYFGFIVIDQLFCSYECAGVAEPSRNPDEWPRQHTVFGQQKRAFFSEDEAVTFLRKGNIRDKQAYYCDFCHTWHVGSPKRPTAVPATGLAITATAPWAGREGDR